MKHLIFAIFFALGFSLWTPSANALFEIRGHYAAHQVTSNFSTAYPELKALPGLGADLILSLPLIPIGFGVRMEQLGGTLSTQIASVDTEVSVKMNRTSLVVNKRFIDLLAYLGVIGTFGMSQTNTVKLISGSTTVVDHNPTTGSMNYTVGIEGGARLLGFIVGGEVGYQNIPLKDVEDGTGTKKDVTLGGTYVKMMLGFGF